MSETRSRTERFVWTGDEVVWSQCAYCKHDSIVPGPPPVCAAFPGGIPAPILANKADHRRPYEGDEGMGRPGEHILFEPKEGVPAADLAALYNILDEI